MGIESGVNTTFSIDAVIRGNMMFRPKIRASLAYGLFNQNQNKFKQGHPVDTPFSPHKVSKWSGLKDAMKAILPSIGQIADLALPGISSLVKSAGNLL